MNIELQIQDALVPIEVLEYDPSNLRKHTPKGQKALCDSLLTYGQVKPIVIDTSNRVYAGNGLLRAMRDLQAAFEELRGGRAFDDHDDALGIRPEHMAQIISKALDFSVVRVVRVDGNTDPERFERLMRAYGLIDNRTTDLSEFDYQGVSAFFKEFHETDLETISQIGWDDYEITPLISAVWTPPVVEEGGLDVENSASNRGEPIRLTKTQREVVDKALSHARVLGDSKLTDGEAVVVVCEFYAAKAKKPRKVTP